jgi:hypothetical protein
VYNPPSLSLLAEASSAIIIDNGKKNNNATINHDGIAAGPSATAFEAMLPNPKVGTKINIIKVHKPSFFVLFMIFLRKFIFLSQWPEIQLLNCL